MTGGILHQVLDFPRLRAVLPLVDDSRLVSPLGKDARASLVAVSDADLEGVIVKPWIRGTGTTVEFLLQELE